MLSACPPRDLTLSSAPPPPHTPPHPARRLLVGGHPRPAAQPASAPPAPGAPNSQGRADGAGAHQAAYAPPSGLSPWAVTRALATPPRASARGAELKELVRRLLFTFYG